jgi:hypothetical protein
VKRVLLLLAVLCAVAGLGFTSGCGLTKKLTGTLHANQPPHTVLFVNGPVDTVNHIVHLYWFGTDVDGSVVGFEWQMKNPATPADTAWHFTTNTDSIFVVQAPSGYTNPVFSVRAIDNEGARDPNPPRQHFQFSNQAPIVKFVQAPLPTDTTFASVTVTWNGTDVDGDVGKLQYLVWLDGNQATPEMTTATSLTMPSSRFLVNGSMTTGTRKIYVRAIDDGGRAGPADSASWVVRRPVLGTRARLLIVDDVPRTSANNLRFDTLYSNSVGRVALPADQYTILRLDTTQPFKSAADVAQTFKLFETVVWYRGIETSFSTLLQTAEPGIAAYLDGGGKFYLDGLYLIAGQNAVGPLDQAFVRSHLNSNGMISMFTTTTTFSDSSIGFGNSGTSVFLPHVDVGFGNIARDSMYTRQFAVRPGEAGGLRQFQYNDRSQVVLWGGLGTLTPDIGDSTAVGVAVPQPSGGIAIVVCMPPGGSVPPVGPGNVAGSAARFVTNIYRMLGLDRP